MPLDGWKFDSADGKSMSKPLYRIHSYAHRLPVAVHLDAGAGAEFQSSPVGDFLHFASPPGRTPTWAPPISPMMRTIM
jgi:hypothetical protein